MSHRASEAARKRAEDAKQAIKAFEAYATFIADKRHREAERAPEENARAWRWVAHYRLELEAIARHHGLEFGEVVRAAHRRVRWKRVNLPEAVVADLKQLCEQHSLYDAWSAEPPPETFATIVTVAIHPDEDATFTHHTRSTDAWLSDLDLDARVDRIGDVVHATASAELRVGDMVSATVARAVDRRENARRRAEWERRGSDIEQLPDLLPSRTTWFLRLSPTEIFEVSSEHPGSHALLSYLIGRISLAEVLAALDREDDMPDWLTIPSVPHWWQFSDPDAGAGEEDDTTRLEQFCRAWSSLSKIFGDIEARSAREYERMERALTPGEAAEIRRLAVEEGQSDAGIGRAFRTVWDEFVADPGVRTVSDEDIGKRLRTVVAPPTSARTPQRHHGSFRTRR